MNFTFSHEEGDIGLVAVGGKYFPHLDKYGKLPENACIVVGNSYIMWPGFAPEWSHCNAATI